MTLKQIECFLALAERLNFTQTANDLFMVQTTLSHSISTLEKELGVKLFDRTSRTVTLTPAGAAYRRECAGVLETCRRAEAAARLAEQGYQGELKIGILQDHFDVQAVNIYRAMADRYPDIRLDMRELNHSQLFSHLETGELDAVIHIGSFSVCEGQDMYPLAHESQCVVVPPDSPFAQAESVAVDELRNEKFVIMSRTVSQPGHDFLWKTTAAAGFVPNVVGEASHVPSLLMMVAYGMGVTFMTDCVADLAKGLVKFVPLRNVPPCIHGLVWQKENPNASLPFLLDTVQDIFPSDV